jgi:O-antigen/teichoic acid export membrane protein
MILGTKVERKPSVGLRLLRASGLVALGNILSRLIALLFIIICARFLSEVEFGAFGVVQGTLTMFSIAAGLALGMGATRFIALYRAIDLERVQGVVLVVLCVGTVSSTLAALALIFLAPWLAANWLYDVTLTSPLRWSAGQLWMASQYGLVAGLIAGTERFALLSLTSITQNLIILLVAFILIPLFNVIGAIGAQAVGFGCAVALGLWCIRDLFGKFNWSTLRQHFRDEGRLLLDFCLPQVIGGLFLYPSFWIALALITREEKGFVEVAYFTAADRYRLILLFIATFVGTALLPILTGEQAREEEPGAGKGLELALIGSSILIVPLSAIIAFGGPEIMSLFGRSYRVNWSVLLPVIAWAGAGAHQSTIGMALLAHGRQWLHSIQQVLYGIIVILLTYMLRKSGGSGLALAHMLTMLMLLLIFLPILRYLKVLSLRSMLVIITSTCIICLLCTLAWLCPEQWRLALGVPVSILVLICSILVFTTRSERKRFSRLIKPSGWETWALRDQNR